MSLREAAQQALEALDAYSWEQVNAARAALRTALAEPEQDDTALLRQAVLDTIDELMGAQRERHPMFSEGYDHALLHLKEFVSAREKK
jgi:uncharacterized protein with NRDE domain